MVKRLKRSRDALAARQTSDQRVKIKKGCFTKDQKELVEHVTNAESMIALAAQGSKDGLNEKWVGGFFRRLAKLITTGKLQPDSVEVMHLVQLARNLSMSNSTSHRFCKTYNSLMSVVYKMKSGR